MLPRNQKAMNRIAVISQQVCAAVADPSMVSADAQTHREKGVAVVKLNRPKALNALCDACMLALEDALKEIQADDAIKVVVLAGEGRAFAAGADIKEMNARDSNQVYKDNMLQQWGGALKALRKPIIAAVHGFALGGGCELAMMCDILLAAEGTKFGQPEITLGIIPGGGGTQRLTRAIGKSKSMEWCLTGKLYSAAEAEKAGLVSRVVPADKLMEEALKLATDIASFSRPILERCKEAVNSAFELSLKDGVDFERRMFHSCWATDDQKEGMTAFEEKRKPAFQDK